MTRSARDVLLDYLAAQSSGDVAAALSMVSDGAVFDVGRGRYEGARVRGFLERLRSVRSVTIPLHLQDRSSTNVVAVLEQRDDDLTPLGIGSIRLDAEVEVGPDGRITRFTARPTPESLAAIAAARDGGHRSEGVTLAERAGTLPAAQAE